MPHVRPQYSQINTKKKKKSSNVTATDSRFKSIVSVVTEGSLNFLSPSQKVAHLFL